MNTNSFSLKKHRGDIVFYAAIFLTIFGARCSYIKWAGSYLPFWDQWFGEFQNLFIPYILDLLNIKHFLRPHNEHIIFTTRITSLILFVGNKYWDTKALLLVSALLRSFNIVFIYHILRPHFDVLSRIGLTLVLLIISGLPYNTFNLLSGFQIQFYYLELFSIASLYCFFGKTKFTITNFPSVLIFLILAFISMASGFFPALVIIVVLIFHQIIDKKLDGQKIFQIGILALISIICYLSTPHVLFKTENFYSFIRSFFTCLSWPFEGHLFVGIINYLPLIFLFRKLILVEKNSDHFGWFVLSLGGWVILQSIAISYGRSLVCDKELIRYSDIFGIGYLANFLAILLLLESGGKHITSFVKKVIITMILLWISFCFSQFVYYESIPYLTKSSRVIQTIESKFRESLNSGNWKEAKQNLNRLSEEFSRNDFSFINDPVRKYSINPYGLFFLEKQGGSVKSILHPDLTVMGKTTWFSSICKIIIDNALPIVCLGLFLLLGSSLVKIKEHTRILD